MKWGEQSTEVSCLLTPEDHADYKTQLKIVFEENSIDPSREKISKIAFINGKPYKSSTSYLSQRFGSFELGFHAVVFNPSDHDLVRGEPALRRNYLDRVIAAESVDYLKLTSRYQRVATQRNAILKAEPRPAREILAGFTEQMATYAAQITYQRLEWVLSLLNGSTKRCIKSHQSSPI